MARIALVTGAGSGIGAATCQALARDGLTIVGGDVNEDAAKRTIAGLPGSGHSVRKFDVREEDQVAAAFAAIERELGPINVLVCAAGGTVNTQDYRPAIVDTPLADWITTEALNARSTFLCIREYFRCRRAKPAPDGRIVTFASLAAEAPGSPTGAPYAAAKAAIIGLTRQAALEAGPMGATVNAVAPGAIDTPAFRATVPDKAAEMVAGNTPIRRLGQPSDVASAIAFLVSPAASFMTGCTIDVNGGRLMH
jgi:3-oxoacyl-[acyl-carrier protein] reductase